MYTLENAVAGSRYLSSSDRFAPVFNPATGEQIGQVPLSTNDEMAAAVAAAKAAQPAWGNLPPAKRARVMFKFLQLLNENLDALAKEVSREHGKTHEDAVGECTRGLEVVEYACGIPQMLKGEFSRNVGPSIDTYADRQPLGVVAGITPFNFPAMVPMWMYPMAIAAGNAFVLKPSERDPSASMLAWDLLKQAGLPDGIFNIVHGDKSAVDAILDNPDIKAVSFVGSTPIAQYVYERGTKAGKRVQALGGAKNHMIIMPDADMDQAANALMGAGFGSAGERCMAISVAVPVGKETADRLVAALKPRIEALKIGPSSDSSAEMGPLITKMHQQKVIDYIDQGEKAGADLVVDGRGFSLQGYENGYFVGGTLFDNVTEDMSIYRDEIFGPVLSVVRKDSFDDAVELIHGHQYANGTAIFTRDGDTARAFADQIEVGMVGINVPIPVPVAYHSFGGWKRSSFGDHSIYGPEGVHFYTRLKTITTRWPRGVKEGAVFTFPS
ncbi:Methylmalonate-semialdehyde dehydrogenase [hydrothermal vent metagenome]|uniref:methylmalonate-semialdehyde dehydrogenase (CoA acylating) n=1 Tax=hydrothermal vent metagenome TaxID=652676 RepID=A0A3B0TMS0_9ZZZZ